jgi:hypothetical protein
LTVYVNSSGHSRMRRSWRFWSHLRVWCSCLWRCFLPGSFDRDHQTKGMPDLVAQVWVHWPSQKYHLGSFLPKARYRFW